VEFGLSKRPMLFEILMNTRGSVSHALAGRQKSSPVLCIVCAWIPVLSARIETAIRDAYITRA